MTHTRLAAWVLALAVLFGVGFRVHAIAHKTGITHDEGITYLAATGHQMEYSLLPYDHRYPFGLWVPASEWKPFIERDRMFCFRKIGSDLATYDIHPPLYFWMLHVWLWIFDVHLWSGPLLNLLITLVTIFTLYRFASAMLGNRLQAAAVTFVWAVSPYLLEETLEARAYGLLALLTLLIVWRTIVYAERDERPGFKELAVLALITTAGALTHYHFALAAAGCGLYAIAKLFRRHKPRLLMFVAAVTTGYGLFALLHPHFLQSLGQQQDQAQAFTLGDFGTRVVRATTAFSEFYFHRRLGNVALLVIAMLLVVAVIFVLRKRHSPSLEPIRNRVSAIVFFLTWFSSTVVFLYVSFISPQHAMGSKYLSMAWPFFAFIPIFAFRAAAERARVALVTGLCLWVFAYAGAHALVLQFRDSKWPKPNSILNGSEVVLVDTVARGVLPRIFWHLPSDQMIFAASQEYLLENPNLWIDGLSTNTLYFSHLGYGNALEMRNSIVAELQQRYDLLPIDEGVWTVGDIFRLKDRTEGEAP